MLRAIRFDVSWLFLFPWVLWLFFEVFRHFIQFSSGPHLNAMDVAGNPIKATDWRPGAPETELFYCLSALLVVHVIQRKGIVPWTKVALSIAVFLAATILPLTVDFFFLHAGAEPIYWIVLAQVIPLALPFIYCVWLASVTRNMVWFFIGIALAFPVVSWLGMRADLTMDDAEQLQPGPWNLYLTQGFLASWICGVGLVIAMVVRLFAKNVSFGWGLGLLTFAVSFSILVGWSRAYPSLVYRDSPPIPIVPLRLPPDYFKPITWEPDDHGEYVGRGYNTQMAYAELNRVPTDDGPFPVIDSIQAKFILPDGQSFDLWPPQVTYYFEKTTTDAFSQRYPGLAGGGKLPLFRFTHELREKLRGKSGTLVLAMDGRMVKLVKQAEVSLRQGKSERLNFPNGTTLVWQGGSMRESWTNLQIAARIYQPGCYHTVEMGEGRLLFVLSDAARRRASLAHRKFYPDADGSDPWYCGWHIDLSNVSFSVARRPDSAGDPEPQFLLPVDRLKLTVFEAQSWERFTTSISIPDFAIPKFPPDRPNPRW